MRSLPTLVLIVALVLALGKRGERESVPPHNGLATPKRTNTKPYLPPPPSFLPASRPAEATFWRWGGGGCGWGGCGGWWGPRWGWNGGWGGGYGCGYGCGRKLLARVAGDA
jgi:hypothetical protein